MRPTNQLLRSFQGCQNSLGTYKSSSILPPSRCGIHSLGITFSLVIQHLLSNYLN
jgi:hypothetical protein